MRSVRRFAVDRSAGVLLAAFSAVALSAQSTNLSERILSTSSRAFVAFDAFAADVERSDVVLLITQASPPDTPRFAVTLLKALAGSRDVILALDVVDRAAQDPLEHFQMEHLTDQEFIVQSKMPATLAPAFLPLIKFAMARTWPVVATGPPSPGGEHETSAAIVQAVTIGSAGRKRPLLVSLHTLSANDVSDRVVPRVRQPLPGRRVLIVRFVAVRSLETINPGNDAPQDVDYVVYTRR